MCVFFFKQKTAYELRISYWSSDVCSSDLALEAEVELASRDGLRRLALDAFILGNRKTARRPDELVTAIIVPKPSGRARSRFLKLGARKYLVISIVMVATLLDLRRWQGGEGARGRRLLRGPCPSSAGGGGGARRPALRSRAACARW